MNIYVGNLASEATDESIREAFQSFGQVTSARVIKDKYSGQSRGFGFVEMETQSQAQEAIKSLNGKELLGKEMSVSEARPRPRDGRSGGEGRSGGGRMGYGGRGNRY
jgi:RNA recognition motif-containing protein